MKTAGEMIAELGVVPVVVLDDVKDAKPLAKALMEGGLPCAEVTFRTQAAEESIKIMASEYPEMFVGAGTVLTTEQVDRAVAAGAKFIVSPGFDGEIVDYCLEKGIPVFPGCVTPSEVAQAVTTLLFKPLAPYFIEILPAPILTIIIGTVKGEHLVGFFSSIILC